MPHVGDRHFRRVTPQGATTSGAGGAGGVGGNAGGAGSVELDAIDRMDGNVALSAADTKLRTSSLAAAGPTRTQVPSLVADWKTTTVEAAAKDAARVELEPILDKELADLAQQNGAPLSDDQRDGAIDDFFERRAAELNALTKTYVADMSKNVERTVQQVIADMRPEVAQRRDPFTPIAQRDPVARSREMVLWESPHAMVVADLFAPIPKALVVPKQAAMFPVDLHKPMLDELALLAAHVSDAFMDAYGTPPAGIWVNAPQDLTVKQLHVHVMPDLPRWSAMLGAEGIDLQGPVARDPAAMAAAQKFFDGVQKALERKLGPST